MDGPGGYKIEPGWWNKSPDQFRDQIERYCVNCSGAVPMNPVDANLGKDLVSPSIVEKLVGVNSPRFQKGRTTTSKEVYSKKEIDQTKKNWKPWSHRPFRQCGPNMFLDENGKVVNEKVFHGG